MLQIKFLGQYEIRLDGQPVIIPSRPAQSLLAYLLLHPNTLHRREKLAGQFWPSSIESNARSNLRHELWRIRKALGSGADARVKSDDLGLTYHPQPGDQMDVDTFETSSEDNVSTDTLLLAVSAYGGDLLPGFYEEWVVLKREQLQAAFDRKLGRLLDRLLVEKRWSEALKWGEHWVASGGIPEPAYRALMLAHAGLGNLAGAATQYQRCVEVLARELGVEPSERTRKAYEQVRAGELETILNESIITVPATPTMLAFLDGPEKPTPVFVGREPELSTLDEYLNEALRGQARIIFLSGEAGSGKSALLQTFVRRSVTAYADLLVGWGSCNAFFGQGDPYLPFRDILNMLAGDIELLYMNGTISRNQAQHLCAAFPLVARSLAEQGPGLLNTFLSSSTFITRSAAILPGEQTLKRQIENAARDPASAREHEKVQFFEQYTQVLQYIAVQHPILIILDDLQWMDPGSGRLLFHLIRRLQNARILIAGAYRAEEIASGRHGERHPLEPLLNEFKTSFGKILIDLDQVRETSGRDFIDAFLDTEPNRLDEAFRHELHQRTQGNPLFTIQLLRNLEEREEIIQDEQMHWIASSHLNWDRLSPKVEGVLSERIGRLDRDLQDLLLAASVEGEQFTLQVLERLQGKASRVILRQLSRELEKRHRLVQELGETYVGGQRLVRFRFVHTLIQQYLYRQLGTAERAAIHLEIADALESLYKEDTALIAIRLAHHYREAGIKEKAARYLLLAGDRARNLYAHQEAIDHYQQALIYLKGSGAIEESARTLMKLYLVYHSSFDFKRAQQVLVEANTLWPRLSERESSQPLPPSQDPYRLATLKVPVFDPALCETLFDLEWVKQLFCGLMEWSEDRNVIPLAARHWDVLDGGCRYIFHIREDILWSDGEPLTAGDFEFAWKRVLNPATHSLVANLLYDIVGARDFHQGRAASSQRVGIRSPDPYTLIIELEEPCGYFPYILADPISYAVPKHVVEREGDAWSQPERIVTSGAFHLECRDHMSEKKIHFTRNPRYFGDFRGNIERVELAFYENELDMYRSFIEGELHLVEFLIPPSQQDEWDQYRASGQLRIAPMPFVDAIYFITDQPPFDNPDLRRAFVLATDREKLAHETGNQIPATGGYIPPGLAGHSPDISLPYDPQQARQILTAAGYPQGSGFPPVNMLIELVGLKKGDNLVFTLLQEMWKENLGIAIQKCRLYISTRNFEVRQDFHFLFLGWLADYPDPASFLQTNFLIDRTHWRNPIFDRLIEEGRHTLDQDQRIELYRQADRVLMEEAVVLPLFYGHVYELRQPWIHKPVGSSIYSSKWKDIILMPH